MHEFPAAPAKVRVVAIGRRVWQVQDMTIPSSPNPAHSEPARRRGATAVMLLLACIGTVWSVNAVYAGLSNLLTQP